MYEPGPTSFVLFASEWIFRSDLKTNAIDLNYDKFLLTARISKNPPEKYFSQGVQEILQILLNLSLRLLQTDCGFAI